MLFASGLRNVGSDHLLDFLQVYAPSPVSGSRWLARGAVESVGVRPDSEAEMVLRKVDDREPLSLYVFKTMSDSFAGRISFFKVFSG